MKEIAVICLLFISTATNADDTLFQKIKKQIAPESYWTDKVKHFSLMVDFERGDLETCRLELENMKITRKNDIRIGEINDHLSFKQSERQWEESYENKVSWCDDVRASLTENTRLLSDAQQEAAHKPPEKPGIGSAIMDGLSDFWAGLTGRPPAPRVSPPTQELPGEPPVEGARLAPDGYWYVTVNGIFYRVVPQSSENPPVQGAKQGEYEKWDKYYKVAPN